MRRLGCPSINRSSLPRITSGGACFCTSTPGSSITSSEAMPISAFRPTLMQEKVTKAFSFFFLTVDRIFNFFHSRKLQLPARGRHLEMVQRQRYLKRLLLVPLTCFLSQASSPRSTVSPLSTLMRSSAISVKVPMRSLSPNSKEEELKLNTE